ncbi:MAG: YihY family inner membrane protein [Deltaproteobacteria bacterium]|uniref:YihY family inner membrane protein n=1 Tax=Candidatus Zymogenus saltonus TaxID=2844893 RepID=A0A9D8PPT5_9DELT|nr:YihY family inner membrane protein [Candidatus Zymogenus saltonus]
MFKGTLLKIQKRITNILTMKITSSHEGEITVESFIKREWNTIKLIYQTLVGRNVSIRAAALTFTTLISLIPMLAFAFSILNALKVNYKAKEYIIERIPGLSDVASTVINYIDNTNFATLGSIGLVVTFTAVYFALGSFEQTINNIWGIRQKRPLLARTSYYTSIVVLSPIIIFFSIGLNTMMESNTIVEKLSEIFIFSTLLKIFFRLLPYFVIWLLFTFIYKVIPNTRVKLTSALFGSVVGGTLWQLTLYFYTKFQFGLARYKIIYSVFASIPFFMVWLYLSWLMIILGAVAAYIHQNYGGFRSYAATERVSFSFRERLALRIFMAIAVNFHEGREPLGSEELSEFLDIPVHLINDVLFVLISEGLISQMANDEGGYLPVKDLSKIRFTDVMEALRENGENPQEHIAKAEKGFLSETIEEILKDARIKYKDVTFDDLCKAHAKEYAAEIKKSIKKIEETAGK